MEGRRLTMRNCLHCGRRLTIAARGLCMSCYRDKAVRERYPTFTPYAAPSDDGARRCEAGGFRLAGGHSSRSQEPDVVTGLMAGLPWYAPVQYSPTVIRHGGIRETRSGL